MLTLNYYVEISATPQRVWEVLTDVELYKRWAQAFHRSLNLKELGKKEVASLFLIQIWAGQGRS